MKPRGDRPGPGPAHSHLPDIEPGTLTPLETPASSAGSFCAELEARLRALTAERFAAAVSSGPAALHLLLRTVGTAPDDLVLLSPLSTPGLVSAVLACQAVPVFLDIEPSDLTVPNRVLSDFVRGLGTSARAAGARLPRRGWTRIGTLKAVLLREGLADPGYLQRVQGVLPQGTLLVRDAAPGTWLPQPVQAPQAKPSAAIYSFLPGAGYPGVDCGMACAATGPLDQRLRELRDDPLAGPGSPCAPGLLQVRLWSAQLDKAKRIASQLQDRRAAYDAVLGSCPGLQLFPEYSGGGMEYWVGLDDPALLPEIIAELNLLNVPAQAHPRPVPLSPQLKAAFGYQEGDFPVAERLCGSLLSLPFSHKLPLRQVRRTAEHLVRLVE